MTSTGKKVLLMGRSGSGKSSMRTLIFSNYKPMDTRMLGATIDVEHSNLKFLNNLTLNLWDCGGQDVFFENYLSDEQPFKNAEVLIHVFDVESREITKDIDTFRRVLEKLAKLSPNVNIFCLIHKMDLIDQHKKKELFNVMSERVKIVAKNFNFNVKCFPSSIYDESVFKAWSMVVSALIPNVADFEDKVDKLITSFNAKEITLLERTTALIIATSSNTDANYIPASILKEQKKKTKPNPKTSQVAWKRTRHGMLSAIIKSHKHLCNTLRTSFATLSMTGPETTVHISSLTQNILILIITSNKDEEDGLFIDSENLLEANLEVARKVFEKM